LLGLLGSRRGLWFGLGTSSLVVLTITLFERQSSGWVGFAPVSGDPTLIVVGFYILMMTLVALFLDRFGVALRVALTEALAREQELEQLRAAQALTIAERTASLEAALKESGEREAQLLQALTSLEEQRAAIRE